MKTLLLATALGLITAQAQDPLSFPDPDISGKWYISAFISETGSPVAQASPILFTVLSSGDVRTSTVYRIDNQCHEVEVTLEKTGTPGKYRAFGGRSYVQVEEAPVRDYLMFYCEGQHERRFRTAKLVGRHPDVNPEALEAFKKFTQRKGLPEKDIHMPEQMERCVPTPSHT
ncbi:vomeronasal secretory protein 1-like [Mustela lutreola]|uniref:vomeronasal secretory protein 1-like n=1 Tax=Mustela lutreola TaxID=9666 RepID=UPI002797BC3A|nr:vomeronasal secretory protein 1-like [Mustela lutreola]XP_058998554.1 vomeronasal secretory protein 1-like [Mustela lutreola]